MEAVMTVGVDTLDTRVLLEEITQSAEPVRDRESPSLEPDYYGCGACLSRLRPGSTGTISNTGNSSCLWLLQAEDRRAEIQLVCRQISLPTCQSRASGGHHGGIPSLDNVLLISPGWDLTKSWLYCGRATERLGLVTHISYGGRMTLVYRHSQAGPLAVIHCTYSVI